MTLIRTVMTVIALAVVCVTAPVMAQGKAKPGGGGSGDGRRAFYLTKNKHVGSEATSACAPGFHMAALTEIRDPSGLRYDQTLGYTHFDAGLGAPHATIGWIRTGMWSAGNTAGLAQCASGSEPWASNHWSAIGSGVFLDYEWAPSGTFNPLAPYKATTQNCDVPQRVWCVQD